MERDDAYLKHVRDSIFNIEQFTQDITYQEFSKNKLIQDATIRELEIIGEAVKRISEHLKTEHSDIPWKDIAGTRDKLIHDYFDVDLEAVWKMIKEDLKVLKHQIVDILDKKS